MSSRRSPGKNQTIHAPEAAREAAWVPPLRRHAGVNGGPGFITICVRVLSGDSEHDFNAKFAEGGQLLASKVCNAIAGKEGLSDVAKGVFALWIVGKDLGECHPEGYYTAANACQGLLCICLTTRLT